MGADVRCDGTHLHLHLRGASPGGLSRTAQAGKYTDEFSKDLLSSMMVTGDASDGVRLQISRLSAKCGIGTCIGLGGIGARPSGIGARSGIGPRGAPVDQHAMLRSIRAALDGLRHRALETHTMHVWSELVDSWVSSVASRCTSSPSPSTFPQHDQSKMPAGGSAALGAVAPPDK
eukprot:362487-Pyramimonas_sp.AAC.1